MPQILGAFADTPTVRQFWGVAAWLSGSTQLMQDWSRGIAAQGSAKGSEDPVWDAFAFLHEAGHYVSLLLTRPSLAELRPITAALFQLLGPARPKRGAALWDDSGARNAQLITWLQSSLQLEELRATLIALAWLAPELRAAIGPVVQQTMADEGNTETFERLAMMTKDGWRRGWWMTIFAEFVDQAAPADGLRTIQDALTAEGALNWTDEQWNGWLEQWRAGVAPNLGWKGEEPGWDITFVGSRRGRIRIEATPNEGVGAIVPDHGQLPAIQEALFFESLRQQLAQLATVRALRCPFQRGGKECCGFGRELRRVWERLPAQFRDDEGVSAPAQMCLSYAPGRGC